jgi:hypothetical protein
MATLKSTTVFGGVLGLLPLILAVQCNFMFADPSRVTT